MQALKETVYTCRCGHKQTITDFADEKPLPVTCCVKCRAGFGVELPMMLGSHTGMFPGKSVMID